MNSKIFVSFIVTAILYSNLDIIGVEEAIVYGQTSYPLEKIKLIKVSIFLALFLLVYVLIYSLSRWKKYITFSEDMSDEAKL